MEATFFTSTRKEKCCEILTNAEMHASRYGTNIRYISEGPSRNICRAWFARFATRKKSLFPGWRGRFMRVFEKYRLTIRQSFESSLRFSNETISSSSNSLARSLARPPTPSARDELFAVNFGQTLSSRGGYHESGGNCSKT